MTCHVGESTLITVVAIFFVAINSFRIGTDCLFVWFRCVHVPCSAATRGQPCSTERRMCLCLAREPAGIFSAWCELAVTPLTQ